MKKRLCILIIAIMSLAQGYALDIIFRFDDFRLKDDVLQNQLIEVFAEENVSLHVGIIPFNRDTTPSVQESAALERVKQLQQEGNLQLALHGFCHKGETFQGEFMTLTEDEPRFRLEKGSHLLDSLFGYHVHIFIPPWNKYNQITLDALADLGYDIISSELVDHQLVTDDRFQYYPESVDHPSKLQKIIERNAKRDGLVVCMFHRSSFMESFSMDDLRKILQSIKVNPNLHIVTMDELYLRDQSFNARRIKSNLHHPLLTKILHTRNVLLTTNDVLKIRVIDLIFHMLIVLLIAGIGAIFLKHQNKWYWVVQSFVFIIAGLQTWYQFVMPKVGLPLIAIVSIAVVCLFYLLRKYER